MGSSRFCGMMLPGMGVPRGSCNVNHCCCCTQADRRAQFGKIAVAHGVVGHG